MRPTKAQLTKAREAIQYLSKSITEVWGAALYELGTSHPLFNWFVECTQVLEKGVDIIGEELDKP